jgi:hypothetical protein
MRKCSEHEGCAMSLCFSGLEEPCRLQPVTIDVSPQHPLIKLAHVIPWPTLAELVLADLKATTAKGKWWLGRKLKLRIHLGALLLHWLYNLTDRQLEWSLNDNAAYQLFCGFGIVENWHCPDHTKIEEFRSRLSPETQRVIANQLAVWARDLGFADPAVMDIDSTVQEANIAYPSDAHLMVKMTGLVNKVWSYLSEHLSPFDHASLRVDVKAVKAKAKAYWFRKRQDAEQTQATFEALWHEAMAQITPVKKYFGALSAEDVNRLPWNIRRAWDQVNTYCSEYFLHAASFMCRGVVVAEKALSFHAEAVSCFNKGKVGKGLQFGRAFQLGRIGGNFLLVGAGDSIRMEDKASVRPMVETHQALFGDESLHSFGCDKNYYSKKNQRYLDNLDALDECCLQQPGRDTASLPVDEQATHTRLVNRRAGIEPLIGHAKHGGQLGRSRMKQDDSTLAAGYGSIAGFNLRQLVRHLLGKKITPMDANPTPPTKALAANVNPAIA